MSESFKPWPTVANRNAFSPNAMRVMEKQKYLWPKADGSTETVEECFWRVATCAAKANCKFLEHDRVGEDFEEYRKLAYTYLMEGLFIPNTPTIVNAGKPKGQLSACFVVPLEDDTAGIFQTIKDAVLIQTSGGGTGFSGSRLRGDGSKVGSTGKVSGGPISVLKTANAASLFFITQGSARNGANMFDLHCKHIDVEKFVDVKAFQLGALHAKMSAGEQLTTEEKIFLRNGTDISEFNISVAATDEFMKLAVEGDRELPNWQIECPVQQDRKKIINAYGLLKKIVTNAWRTGDPGLLFIDRANRDNPTPQIGQFETTNPCQPLWAPVLTPNGMAKIGSMKVGDSIWHGRRWTKITNIAHTGVKPVYEYRTTAGVFYGTQEHRVVSNGTKIEVKDAGSIDICSGYIEQDVEFDDQTVMDGLVIGDRSVNVSNNLVGLHIGQDDQDYLESSVAKFIKRHRPGISPTFYEVTTKVTPNELGLIHRREVPERYKFGNFKTVRSFLRGIFSANGNVKVEHDRITLRAVSFSIVSDVQMMLSAIGIRSYYSTNKPHVTGTYISKQSYDINITIDRGLFARYVGFIQTYKAKDLATISATSFSGKYKSSYEIRDTKLIGEEPVIDITVDDPDHTYWSGGHLVSNCGEQWLLPYEACTLGHINLAKYCTWEGDIDWDGLHSAFAFATRFLDNIVEASYYPVPAIEKMHKNGNRKVGVGVLGFADMLVKLGIRYGSPECLNLISNLGDCWRNATDAASIDLAAERGAFNHYPGSALDGIAPAGIRNACRRTVAPTGSTSIIVGTMGAGIEPGWLMLTRQQAGMKMFEVAPLFQEYLDRKFGKSLHDPILRYLDENKTLKGISNSILFTDRAAAVELERLFVQAGDVTPTEHVKVQAEWQRYADNAISKTINMPNTATEQEIMDAYILAWRLGCKGITVYRDGSRSGQPLSVGTTATKADFEKKVNLDAVKKIVEFAGPVDGAMKEIGEVAAEYIKDELGFDRSVQVPARVTRDQILEKHSAMPDVTEPRVRASVTTGTNRKIPTGCGNAMVYIGENAKGQVDDVTFRLGKGGGCASAQNEALARVVSLALRAGVPVEEVKNQLSGIRCHLPTRYKSPYITDKPVEISSCGDALSKALGEYLYESKVKKNVATIEVLPMVSSVPGMSEQQIAEAAQKIDLYKKPFPDQETFPDQELAKTLIGSKNKKMMGACPQCGGHNLDHGGSCYTCLECGASAC